MEQGDILRDFHLAAGLMPSGAIDGDNGVMAALDLCTDLGEVARHHVGIDGWEHEGCADIACRADCAEDIRPFVAEILGPAGAATES